MDIIFGKDLSSSDYVPAGRSGTGYWSETGNVCLGAANSGLLKIYSIVRLTWIRKGLLMRRARDINCLVKGGWLNIWQN
jgi:DNA repair/transcription protein MET18/MMS19